MIQINHDNCIRCGLCVHDCFPGALTMENNRPALSAPGNCIGCGHCIAVCPRAAVRDDSLNMDDMVLIRKDVTAGDLLGLMRSRRSCRHYRPDPVPEPVLQALLEAARACPTAKNLQATRYIAVTERIPALLDAALEALGQVGELQSKTATAPDELRRAGNFIRWRDLRREDRSFDPMFFHAPLLLMFVSTAENARDAAGAAAYTELMAAAIGLGCLFSGYFTACAAGSQEIHRLLNLRENEQVVRCLVLGWPDIRFQRTAPRKQPDLTRM